MKIIKKKSKTPIKNKEGKEFYPFHYFIVTDNEKYILIKPVNNKEYAKLDMVAVYVR